jgi:hypothetical protein
MSIGLRTILMGLMSAALLFGFLRLFVAGATLNRFERLHIFLFNLCSSGTVLITRVNRRKCFHHKELTLTYWLPPRYTPRKTLR